MQQRRTPMLSNDFTKKTANGFCAQLLVQTIQHNFKESEDLSHC